MSFVDTGRGGEALLQSSSVLSARIIYYREQRTALRFCRRRRRRPLAGHIIVREHLSAAHLGFYKEVEGMVFVAILKYKYIRVDDCYKM